MSLPGRACTHLLLVALSLAMFQGCARTDYVNLNAATPLPPSLQWEDIETMDYMGATLLDSGANFCVYSEKATRIKLALFDDPESNRPTQTIDLNQYGSLWNVFVEGIGVGQHYGYIAWGPNWENLEDETGEEFIPGTMVGFKGDVDLEGNRFNPNKLLTDPYSRAFHRDHDWGKGSVASGPYRTESTYAAASKSVIVESDYTWSSNEDSWWASRSSDSFEDHNANDLIIYEVHLKGFTADRASGVDHPGTYQGFAEKAPYLQELGITAVELLPIHQKENSLGGYWGYSNLSYFAPELDYSSTYKLTGEPYEVLDEFKAMVDTLHQHGIEVILDVVYNHHGEGGLWDSKNCPDPSAESCETLSSKELASLYSIRGLDNTAYYELWGENQYYLDHTGVGNTFRANNTPGRRMIMDSLHFWVEEMHVDGFRFDLAAILGEVDGDYTRWDPENTVLKEIIDDPVFQERKIRMIAEPWSVVGYDWSQLNGAYPSSSTDPSYAWYEWNDGFRDFWRMFYNNDSGWSFNSSSHFSLNGGDALTGSNEWYLNKNPYNGVNFVTVHDGYTLFDLFSYNSAYNFCGPLNPICCEDPYSVWCELGDPWDQNEKSWTVCYKEYEWQEECTYLFDYQQRQMMRNVFTLMMISQGTPMMLGGDEWMRTQYGNNNAYGERSDNSYNWFRWGEWQNETSYDKWRMHDFVTKVIQLRKKHKSYFAPSAWEWSNLDWGSADNPAVDPNWDGMALQMLYTGDEQAVAILINGGSNDQNFVLPSGYTWAVVVDTQSYYDLPATNSEIAYGQLGGWFQDQPDLDPRVSANINLDSPQALSQASYLAKPYSIVILEQQ